MAARDPDAEADMEATRNRKLDEWDLPADPKAELLAFFEAAADQRGDGADVTPIEDGATVRAGDETLRAVHTPGHTDGHLAYVREDGSVLTGDALLPKYTPNVGGADPRVDNPLGRYLDTLVWLDGEGFDRAYPGHRDPIENPSARAREIIGHHRERAGQVLDYLRDAGPADPWTVSAHLFGGLSGIHIIHGPGEAYAHLEHMERHGAVERVGDEYRPAAEDPDLAALFPD